MLKLTTIALSILALGNLAAPLVLECPGCGAEDVVTVPGLTVIASPTKSPGECKECPECHAECLGHPCHFSGSWKVKNNFGSDYAFDDGDNPGRLKWVVNETKSLVILEDTALECGKYFVDYKNFGYVLAGLGYSQSGSVKLGCTACPSDSN